jgi:hypothetical protein
MDYFMVSFLASVLGSDLRLNEQDNLEFDY